MTRSRSSVFERAPAVGLWWSPCCYLDLQQITDDDDAVEIVEWREEFGSVAVYGSEEEGLLHDLTSWPAGSEEATEIEERIAEMRGSV